MAENKTYRRVSLRDTDEHRLYERFNASVADHERVISCTFTDTTNADVSMHPVKRWHVDAMIETPMNAAAKTSVPEREPVSFAEWEREVLHRFISAMPVTDATPDWVHVVSTAMLQAREGL